ncbi:hypothetical protein F4561_002496 [Lipingzhangella halophila]|uniref:DUF3592 domain-containing protein n=1 Tax=Lipingzhangella halophila TaxID=1783352 RepID=A0A7W7RHQ1_9ACTN|nr:DUF3592 domain-containing protein [Lipingzhangella halophila]MBB4931676.1 hypothetical protein [Lipingzhangella halophila]
MKSKRKRTKRKLSLGGTVLTWGIIIFIAGVIGVIVGMTDYTDHTETVEADVSERQVEVNYDDDGDRTGEDITIYVDYSAEGTDYTSVVLNGLNTDGYQEGQDLTVAYAPDDPGHVVTPESTEEGAYDFALYLGIVGIGVSVFVIAGGAGLLYLKKRGRLRV